MTTEALRTVSIVVSLRGLGYSTETALADLLDKASAPTPPVSRSTRIGMMARLSWLCSMTAIRAHDRARSAGAQSALGRQPAVERVFIPALLHLADRIASRLRAKALAGRTVTVTVRVRFADMRAVTRSMTLDVPISATTMLAEIATALVRAALADHPHERHITLLAVSLSHLRKQPEIQLDLALGLPDERHRPGTDKASRVGRRIARWTQSGSAMGATQWVMRRLRLVGVGPSPMPSESSPRNTSMKARAEAHATEGWIIRQPIPRRDELHSPCRNVGVLLLHS